MQTSKLRETLRALFTIGSSEIGVGNAEHQIRILSQLTRAVGSTLEDPRAAHVLITEAVTTLLGCERALLFLPEDDGSLELAAASGVVDPGSDPTACVEPELVHAVLAEGRPRSVARGRDRERVLLAPLKVQNEVIGVLVAERSPHVPAFGSDHLRLLEVFGGFAALVASEARLIDELRRRNHELSSLFELVRKVNNEADPARVLQAVVDTAIARTGASSGSLVFVDRARGELIIRASAGLPEDVAQRLKLGIGEGITGWVAREGQSALVPDVRRDARYVEAKGSIRSELAVPVRTGDRVIGVLNVDAERTDAFTSEHQALLEALADLAAAKIRLAFADAESKGEGAHTSTDAPASLEPET